MMYYIFTEWDMGARGMSRTLKNRDSEKGYNEYTTEHEQAVQCGKDGQSNPWRHKQEVVGRLGEAFLLFSIALFSKAIFSWVRKGITRTKDWNMKPRMKERKVKLKQKQISHFSTARELTSGTKLSMEGRRFNLLMGSRWKKAVCAKLGSKHE